jgi:hypothetical protein
MQRIHEREILRHVVGRFPQILRHLPDRRRLAVLPGCRGRKDRNADPRGPRIAAAGPVDEDLTSGNALRQSTESDCTTRTPPASP